MKAGFIHWLTAGLLLRSTWNARAAEDACNSFRIPSSEFQRVDAVAWSSTFFEAGALVNITNLFSSINTTALPAFCRVRLTITTNETSGSFTDSEVWLPEPDAWNGRFLGLGNGGTGGGVDVADLGFDAVAQGFAGMSTDTGHNSTVFDGSWHEPNQIVDWAFRAMHLSVIAGKQVVEAYYGKQEDMKSYYLGCSTGGRQGLKEIQRFPEDFDGIVIGSPANWMSHLQSFSIHINLNVLPVNGSHWIPPALWKGPIHDEVLRQCDMIDGVADGIINNPLACNFRPETLSCRPGQDPSACLTLDQIVALRKIYSAYIETNQTFIFNGYYPGGELGFPNGLVGENILTIAPEYFQLWVLNDTSFSPFDLTLADIELADKIDPGTQNAIDPNITAFVSAPHNGKVLHYVGWADQLISPGNSLHYYDTVQAFMQTETDASVDDFYRLFTVAGMQHCSGGFGANAFGGSGQAAAGMPPLSNDPQHNILSAMVAWVENGTAPDNFTAVWYEDNDATQGVGFSRPLCKFPANLRFDGGNSNASSSFTCV